jgi:hypothetical protein
MDYGHRLMTYVALESLMLRRFPLGFHPAIVADN